MFLKLFKHSFKRSAKTVIMLSIISVGISLLSGVFYRVTANFENTYLKALAGILLSLSTFGISAMGFCSIVLVYNNFRKAVATDEAYLTFTLPATPKQQVASRYLSILLWDVIIGFAMVVSSSYFLPFQVR